MKNMIINIIIKRALPLIAVSAGSLLLAYNVDVFNSFCGQ